MSAGKAKVATLARDNRSRTPRLRRSAAQSFRDQLNGNLHRAGAVTLMPALRVGAANDPLEREAETVAERIVAMSGPEMSAPAAVSNGAVSDDVPSARRTGDQPSLDELNPNPPLPAEQEDVEVPPEQDVKAKGFEGGDLNELESGNPTDTAGEPPAPPSPPPAGDDGIQPDRSGRAESGAAVGLEGGPVPADVGAHVKNSAGGRPLPKDVRTFMEPRFGVDFSDVRIHDGPADRQAAKRIGARAFTLGRQIWFGDSEMPTDKKLVAHELTHVVQQTERPLAGEAAAETTTDVTDRAVRRIEWPSLPELPSLPSLDDIKKIAEGYADRILGYPLMKIILGKSPITGKSVDFTAENLIGGFMSLVPGGHDIFLRIKEAKVLETAFAWVKEQLHLLDLTWSRAMQLVDQITDLFPTLSPFEGIKRIFKPVIDDIITFAGRVKDKVLEFVLKGALKLAGKRGEEVWAVVLKAKDALSMIFEDPLGFAKNLINALVGGFTKFKDNIWEHLKKGLLGWLFGALATADLELPAKLDFKGLVSIVLQVLGLTYDKFRKMLVKRLGAKGERTVSFIEKSVEIVKILVKDGFLGIWQKVLGMIENFKSIVIDGIQKMVITTVIRAGVSWLAGLSNPIGGIIKIALSIYDMIIAFLDRLEQIKQIFSGIFSSLIKIAKGQVGEAEIVIEKVLATAVPVVISFLAAALSLNTIPKKIRDIIKQLQKPIKKVMGKLITWVVKKAKKLLTKLVAKLNSKRKLPSSNFKIGKTQHRVFAKPKGKKAEMMIASDTLQTLEQIDKCIEQERAKLKDKEAKKEAGTLDKATDDGKKETATEIKKIDLKSESKMMRKLLKNLAGEINEIADDFNKAGKDTDKFPVIDTAVERCLFRAKEARNKEIEGFVGTYEQVKKKTAQKIGAKSNATWSDIYEVDHQIEKQFPKTILVNLQWLDPAKPKSSREGRKIWRISKAKAKQKTSTIGKTNKSAKNFFKIGSKAAGMDKIDDNAKKFPAMAIHREIHSRKAKPAVTPAALVQEAQNTDDNPHDVLKAGLQKQFSAEMASVKALYQKDDGAPPDLKKVVADNFQSLSEQNAAIYGFNAEAAAAKGKRDAKTADAPGGSRSDITFAPREGEANRPNIREIEGRGGPYSNQGGDKKKFGRFGDWIEYDHLIEHSFPENIRGESFGEANLKGKIDAKIGSTAAPQRARLDGAPLFPPGHTIHAYTEANGFAIPIYTPIHALTTKGSYSVPNTKAIMKTMPDNVVNLAAEAATAASKSDADTKLTEARGRAHEAIKKKFRSRVSEHGQKVADGYAAEARLVQAANDGHPAAKALIGGVISNVAGSLRKAEKNTDALFPR